MTLPGMVSPEPCIVPLHLKATVTVTELDPPQEAALRVRFR
jgi:hypothetical protein